MPDAQVVELREMTDDFSVVPVLRYVLLGDGAVCAVPLIEGGDALAASIDRDGIPGNDHLLFPSDGSAFLAGLPRVYAGTRFWATPPLVMDQAAALTPPHPLPRPRRQPPPPPPQAVR